MCRTPCQWLRVPAASLLAALALALCVAGAAEPAHASGARFGDPALPANGPDTGDDGAVLGAVAAIAADGAASGSPVALAAVAVIAADGSATPSCDIASLVLRVNNALRAEAARHVAEYKALLGADAAEHEARQLAEVTDECEAASDARYYLLKSIVDGLTSDVAARSSCRRALSRMGVSNSIALPWGSSSTATEPEETGRSVRDHRSRTAAVGAVIFASAREKETRCGRSAPLTTKTAMAPAAETGLLQICEAGPESVLVPTQCMRLSSKAAAIVPFAGKKVKFSVK